MSARTLKCGHSRNLVEGCWACEWNKRVVAEDALAARDRTIEGLTKALEAVVIVERTRMEDVRGLTPGEWRGLVDLAVAALAAAKEGK